MLSIYIVRVEKDPYNGETTNMDVLVTTDMGKVKMWDKEHDIDFSDTLPSTLASGEDHDVIKYKGGKIYLEECSCGDRPNELSDIFFLGLNSTTRGREDC